MANPQVQVPPVNAPQNAPQNVPAAVNPNPPPNPAVQPPAPQPNPAPPQAMPLANMPARGERTAPTFDESTPEDLERYFTELEFLMYRHNIIDEGDRKRAAIRYLKVRTEMLWKSTAAWKDAAKTYIEFKTEVTLLYPGATGDRTYSIQDLDILVGHYSRNGIQNGLELGEYYRRFLLITRYLIERNRMSEQEQSRAFLRGLPPALGARSTQRLEQKFIDHYPNDPYPLGHIYDAVSHVLMGSASISLAQTQPQVPPAQYYAPYQPATYAANPTILTNNSPPDPMEAKVESLATSVATLSDMFKKAMQDRLGPSQSQYQPGVKPRSSGITAVGLSGPNNSCNFCGGSGHFIRECEAVEQLTKAGKVKRGPDGRVALANGAPIPRNIAGAWLRDRAEEWHRLNPGQAASMLFEIAATRVATARSTVASGQVFLGQTAQEASTSYQQAPARNFVLGRHAHSHPEEVDSQPPRRSGRVVQSDNTGGANNQVTPQQQQPQERDRPPPIAQQDYATNEQSRRSQDPLHPYATVPDATNGPTLGAIRQPAREPVDRRQEPAYATAARVHDPKIAKTVFDRAMEMPVTVTQRELLSIAPEIRTQVVDITLRKRIQREPFMQATLEEVDSDDEDDPPPRVATGRNNENARITQATHMPAAFAAAVRRDPPANAAVMTDPYEAYLRTHDHNTGEKGMIVAAESNALRAILPIVEGKEKVEAILDPGCQIVAMSETISNALALPYDPTIRLNMISANGGVDQSLGLARNVAFMIGDIPLYLQVHVLRQPAYDILLGRPFDVLTQSVVRNFENEHQTITLLDPNTGRKVTVPTVPRGCYRYAEQKHISYPTMEEDF
jgi:hypothetical protein